MDRACDFLRRLLALFTAGMAAWSWPLWIGGGEIARVPFVADFRPIPDGWQAVLFSLWLACLAVSGLARRWRPWACCSIAITVLAVLSDQHRFQPWLYQHAMTTMVLVALPGGRGLWLARLWFISLYLHSGLSKLDASFAEGLGPVFLDALSSLAGLNFPAWNREARGMAALALPAGEILVALALLSRQGRKLGRVAAVALHLTLLLILGPAGLGHSALVQAWNLAMAVEVWVAFGPEIAIEPWPVWRYFLAGPAVLAAVAGMALPFGERSGWFDAWPSHALYASHVGWVSVEVRDSARERLPASLRAHSREVEGSPGWWRVDLTGWSRDARGTPVYPQPRACLGLAEAIAARYGVGDSTRAILFGPAGRWTGRRSREQLDGLEAIRRRADLYVIPAHPAAPSRPNSG